jgi:two-component system sensor histidine kinase PilS (NtrC family)
VPFSALLGAGAIEGQEASRVPESTRRILWIVAIYRVVYGVLLFALSLIIDYSKISVLSPWAFIFITGLYVIFGVLSFWKVHGEGFSRLTPSRLALGLLLIDTTFIPMVMLATGSALLPLPILLLPQLALSGWAMGTRTAYVHAAIATIILVGLDLYRAFGGQISSAQTFQTGLIGFGYFTTVAVSIALGRYTRASEALAAKRGVDIANLEQVNHLIIQDMQDGVLVVGDDGVVRGHNIQITRLLGGFGRLQSGMPLTQFSPTLHNYWQHWRVDHNQPLPAFQVDPSQHMLRARLVQIGAAGPSGGTLIYVEDMGRAQAEAQQIKLAAMGRLTASIAHEVRNPLSAINQAAQLLKEDGLDAPSADRLLTMICNNAKRIDRIVSEVLQLNRRDRQQPEAVPLAEVMRQIAEEVVQAEKMPVGTLSVTVPADLIVSFDRGHLGQVIWNLVTNAWQHGSRRADSIRITARLGYHGDVILCEIDDDGPGIAPELHERVFEPFFTTRSSGTGLGLYIARELADANNAALELLQKSPGAHFRLTLKRAKPVPAETGSASAQAAAQAGVQHGA